MLALCSALALAQQPPTAFVHARILPVAGPALTDGTLVVQDGRVSAIGEGLAPPAGATVVDLAGKVVIPGLVDTHSHIGTLGPGELNEGSGPLQPALSAIDAIDATTPSLQLAQAGGVTTVNVMPGSRNLVGGQTAYLKLRDADTVDELLLCADRRKELCGGLKMANGTNPQGEGPYPRTRMAAAAQVRQLFLDAKKRQGELAAAGRSEGGLRPPGTPRSKKRKKKDPAPPPAVDLAKDPLVEVLDGKRVVHFHTHRADDIVTALEIGEEFGFVPVLHHVSEGSKVAERIAAGKAPCSVIVIDSPGGKEEAHELSLATPGVLERAGVQVALHTDDPITDSRLFLRSAALAIRGGMTEEGALAALTLNGAKMLGLEARVGSLEVGKDADFVVLSGDPFSVWTHVEQTWVEGQVVFDRAKEPRYATGGWDQAARYPEVTP